MIIKIYFTLLLLLCVVAGGSWMLMNSDEKRSQMWFKISQLSWISLSVIAVIGAITTIWFS
jgi:hypothetical protein